MLAGLVGESFISSTTKNVCSGRISTRSEIMASSYIRLGKGQRRIKKKEP